MNATLTARLVLMLGLASHAPSFGGPPGDSVSSRENLSASAQRAVDAQERLAAAEVAVAVSSGTVTLSGVVELLADTWLAEETVGDLRGITAIDNRLEVRLHEGGDPKVADDLRRRIASEPTLVSAGVSVEVVDGRATFSGKIPDARLRFVARKIAGQTAGVLGFTDQLESPAASDETIQREATELLAPGSLTGSPGPVAIEVSSGQVRLSGTVRSIAARRLAGERVRGINGVRGVTNAIGIAPNP